VKKRGLTPEEKEAATILIVVGVGFLLGVVFLFAIVASGRL
jgi:hypothetical protein